MSGVELAVTETMSEEKPMSLRSSQQSQNKSSRPRSVIFAQEDLEQVTPSLPLVELIDELERKHGKAAYAREFSKCVQEADTNGDGLISIPELVHVMEVMHNMQQQNTSLRKIIMIGFVALLLVLLSIFGLTFAVVKLTKEISTGGDTGNALVSSHTGIIVDTHPSDGGGIYLDMAAFTKPINITFPMFERTQECVGQIPTGEIDEHYRQFTVGGSSMTISHIDYSEEQQPKVYTVIPASSLSVTGFGIDTSAAERAQTGTETIEAALSPEGRVRMLTEGRVLSDGALIMSGAKDRGEDAVKENSDCNNRPPGGGEREVSCEEDTQSRNEPDGSAEIKSDVIMRGSTGKPGRRLQEEEEPELETVSDYMLAFSEQSIPFSLMKDPELTSEVYFVCRGVSSTVVVS